MATKKSASKKAAGTEAAAEKNTAAKKSPAKKTAAKKATDLQASAPEQTTKAASKTASHTEKAHPSHHDIEIRAYLLWEQDGKKHGHHDQYWKQAERELMG